MATTSSSLYIPLEVLPLRQRKPQWQDHISFSQLSNALSCPFKWSLHSLFKLPQKKTGPLHLGLTVHDVLDRFYKGSYGDEPELEAILDDYEECFTTMRVWRENDGRDDILTADDIDWGKVDPKLAEKAANQMLGHGYQLLRSFFDDGYFQRYVPMGMYYDGCQHEAPLSEYQLNLPLETYGGRRLKELVGRIDMVDDRPRILDWKTKGYKKITQEGFKNDMQPVIYAFMLEELGLLEPPVEFRYVQLHYKAERNGRFSYEIDDSVGGKIPGWRTDVLRQKMLPGLVRRMEWLMDEAEAADDAVTFFESNLNPGSQCNTCDWKKVLCPFYSQIEDTMEEELYGY